MVRALIGVSQLRMKLPWKSKGREGFGTLAANCDCWIVLETGF